MILHDAATIARYQAAGWWGQDPVDSRFRANVAAAPSQIALIDAPNRAGFAPGVAKQLSYAETDAAVDRLAAVLLAAGVRKDMIVVAQLPNCVEIIIAYLACARIGAIVSPMLLAYGERDVRRILCHLRPAAILTLATFKDSHPAAAAARIVREEALETLVFALGDVAGEGFRSLGDLTCGPLNRVGLDAYLATLLVDANEVSSLHWSSGTSGEPKCVPQTHNSWRANGGAVVDAGQIPIGARFLAPMHIVHTAGHAGFFMPWLEVCGTLALHHPFDMALYVSQLEDLRITHTVAAPAMLNALLRSNVLDNHDLSALDVILCGSAPLDPWMIQGFRDRYAIEIVNIFGSTEGITMLSGPTITNDPERRARYFPRFQNAAVRLVTNESWDIRIAAVTETGLCDENGSAISAANTPGEFICRSPAVFPGYYTAAGTLDRRDFDADGFFRTGEIFEIAGDGEDMDYYHYIDRLKDVINRGGQKIPVGELEAAIQSHPAIGEACAIAVRDERLGERVCAVIVPLNGETVTLAGLVAYLRGEGISTFMLPEQLALVDVLPRNPTGKILKRVLATQVAATADA
jgi:acyl-CoA synthetase (AMP-forming)/AMP-acid ligase II